MVIAFSLTRSAKKPDGGSTSRSWGSVRLCRYCLRELALNEPEI